MDFDNELFNLFKRTIRDHDSKRAFVFYSRNSSCMRTYKQILGEGTEISKLLENISNNACVGLFMRHNISIPSIVYSLLQNKICFIFLDPKAPTEENLDIIRDLNIHIVLAEIENDLLSSLFEKKSKHILSLGLQLHKYSKLIVMSVATMNPSINFENMCYVVTTSGTTGKRKYVRVTHHCITSNIKSLRGHFCISAEDNIYFGTPLSFDPCYVELFLGLTTGACLISSTDEIRESTSLLMQTLFNTSKNNSVTVMQMCPSIFLRWTDSDIQYIFNNSKLRILALGGEPFPENILKLKTTSNVKLYNLYGITEVSCWASLYEVQHEGVTLGSILDDTIFELRNQNDSGEGNLYIGSNSRVCLIDDETLENLTYPIFRETGDIVIIDDKDYIYKGRSNDVIKRFGQRFSLQDMEAKIFEVTNLLNKSIWIEDSKKLVTFLSIKGDLQSREKIIDKISVQVRKYLKHIYNPDIIEIVQNFPLTKHGKIDKQLLEKIAISKLTKQINSFKLLWCKYLNLTDSEAVEKKKYTLTELGLSSILKMQFVSEFRMATKTNWNRNAADIIMSSTYEDAVNLIKTMETNDITEFKSNNGIFQLSWRYNLYACIDTTVQIISFKNIRDLKYVAVGNFANIFIILNAKTGKEISQIWLPDNIESKCTIAPEENNVFVGCFDGCMYCLDIETCEIIWQFPTGDRIKNDAIIGTDKNTLIFGSYDKHIYCISLMRGTLIWKQSINEGITANLTIISSKVIAAGINGTIFWIEETNGIIIFKYSINNPIFSSLESSDGDLLVMDVYGSLYYFNQFSYDLAWKFSQLENKGNAAYSSFSVLKNYIIFGTKTKMIYLLEFNNKQCVIKYSVKTDYEIQSKPALFCQNSILYALFMSTSGDVLLYKFIDNVLILIENAVLGSQCFAAPIVDDNNLYIGCRDNYLYCINISL